MSRTALALVLLAASASVASAGGYVGLGIGTSPGTSGDMAYDADGRAGRLHIGYRFGRLAVEGIGSRFDLFRADGYGYSDTSVGVAAKYNMPLGDSFEAFGRGGLQHTTLGSQDGIREDYSGGGFLFGAGFEYRLNLGFVAGASLYVDYTITNSSLTSPAIYGTHEYGFTTRVWTLGATVSL